MSDRSAEFEQIVDAVELAASILKRSKGDFFERDSWYWDIYITDQFNFKKDPSKIVGEISDDLGIVKDKDIAAATPGVFLYKLSQVLRYIAWEFMENGHEP